MQLELGLQMNRGRSNEQGQSKSDLLYGGKPSDQIQGHLRTIMLTWNFFDKTSEHKQTKI